MKDVNVICGQFSGGILRKRIPVYNGENTVDGRISVNNELQRVMKEVALAYFMVLSLQITKYHGTGNSHRDLRCPNHCTEYPPSPILNSFAVAVFPTSVQLSSPTALLRCSLTSFRHKYHETSQHNYTADAVARGPQIIIDVR
jgi:hypothetical protein